MRYALLVTGLLLIACSAPPTIAVTPDASTADTQARRQAVALAATISVLPPIGAPTTTPILTGQAALATVVTAATEVARLRALPPDRTPPPTPVLPMVVAATDRSPSYSIVKWLRSGVDPRRARYLVETVVPDSYAREDVLAVLVAATRLTFNARMGPRQFRSGYGGVAVGSVSSPTTRWQKPHPMASTSQGRGQTTGKFTLDTSDRMANEAMGKWTLTSRCAGSVGAVGNEVVQPDHIAGDGPPDQSEGDLGEEATPTYVAIPQGTQRGQEHRQDEDGK
jgi:hypothetical protein